MKLSSHNHRQLEKMQKQLLVYKSGQFTLGGLIGDLFFLLRSIEQMESSWEKTMYRLFFTLEEMNAISLDSEQMESGKIGISIIKETVEQIEAELANFIHRNACEDYDEED
jgi:hypothetical protein